MNILFLVLGLSNTIVYFYKGNWLINKPQNKFYFFYTLILFLVGIAFLKLGDFDANFVGFLMLPLLNLIVFYILLLIFRKFYKRNPENTFWTFSKRPIQDVIFNLIYWITGFLLPIVIIFEFLI